MKHIGIIAEYNPFHNGHAYQLEQAGLLFPGRKKVVVMSGNFVQRGEPAIFHKFLRTRWALAAGADLVLELAPVFSTASAEYFATAALFSLSATGAVDTLCFGAETDSLSALTDIASLLAEEPAEYQRLLKLHLKYGCSFPRARALAVSGCLSAPETEEILSQPNNILAIEYLKAIRIHRLPITPCLIPRKGNAYHEDRLTPPYASATAIRQALQSEVPLEELGAVLPEPVLQSLATDPSARPLFLSDYYPWLQYALLAPASCLTACQDMSQEICNRIGNLRPLPPDLDELLARLSSRQYPKTRLQRSLLAVLLRISAEDIRLRREHGWISYLRVLGFSQNGAGVLRQMKQACRVPVIIKPAAAKKMLSPVALSCFEEDVRISMLYRQCFLNRYGLLLPSEYEQSVIRG